MLALPAATLHAAFPKVVSRATLLCRGLTGWPGEGDSMVKKLEKQWVTACEIGFLQDSSKPSPYLWSLGGQCSQPRCADHLQAWRCHGLEGGLSLGLGAPRGGTPWGRAVAGHGQAGPRWGGSILSVPAGGKLVRSRAGLGEGA